MKHRLDRRVDRFHDMRRGALGRTDQDHRDAERPRRGDLAIAGRAAAVPRHQRIDAVGFHERPLVVLAERAAGLDIDRIAKRPRGDRIDAPHQVEVPWVAREGIDLLPAEREEDAPACRTERGHRPGDAVDDLPAVLRGGRPGRTAEYDERHPGPGRGRHGMPRDLVGERVRRIDQERDPLRHQIRGEAVDAAEAADPDGDGMRYDVPHPPGERNRRVEARLCRETPGELPGLRRATKYEDALRHG